eukprot:1961733-Rhodomonas_salina.1
MASGFLYCNACFLVLSRYAAVAPLLALLGALHLAHGVQGALRRDAADIYATPNLLPAQDVLARVCDVAKVALLAAAWFTLPLPAAPAEHVLAACFAPELAGAGPRGRPASAHAPARAREQPRAARRRGHADAEAPQAALHGEREQIPRGGQGGGVRAGCRVSAHVRGAPPPHGGQSKARVLPPQQGVLRRVALVQARRAAQAAHGRDRVPDERLYG